MTEQSQKVSAFPDNLSMGFFLRNANVPFYLLFLCFIVSAFQSLSTAYLTSPQAGVSPI